MTHPMCPHCEDAGCFACGGVMLARFGRWQAEADLEDLSGFLRSVNWQGSLSDQTRETLLRAIRWGAEKERERNRAAKGQDAPSDDGFARRFELLDLSRA